VEGGTGEDRDAALERAVFEWAESVVRPAAILAALADLPPEVRGAAVAVVLADLPPPAIPDLRIPSRRYERAEPERRPPAAFTAVRATTWSLRRHA